MSEQNQTLEQRVAQLETRVAQLERTVLLIVPSLGKLGEGIAESSRALSALPKTIAQLRNHDLQILELLMQAHPNLRTSETAGALHVAMTQNEFEAEAAAAIAAKSKAIPPFPGSPGTAPA